MILSLLWSQTIVYVCFMVDKEGRSMNDDVTKRERHTCMDGNDVSRPSTGETSVSGFPLKPNQSLYGRIL